MDASAEGEVWVVAAVPVEAVGVGEHELVSVGGTDAAQDDRTGLDRVARDLHGCGRDAHGHLHGTVEAKQLVDGRRIECGVGA
ncbi:MAG TPA: hypothetical protein VJM33_05745 [Microthrixaceae bacterium]|nr:hypothetical protein [Microthrixaceae bacterium]